MSSEARVACLRSQRVHYLRVEVHRSSSNVSSGYDGLWLLRRGHDGDEPPEFETMTSVMPVLRSGTGVAVGMVPKPYHGQHQGVIMTNNTNTTAFLLAA